MSLLSRPKNSKGSCYQKITPQSANWDFVGFEAHDLKENETLDWKDELNECCMVILSGMANISVDEHEFNNAGERMSVFDDINPHALYAPNKSKIKVTALTKLELAIAIAPGFGNFPARHIRPDEMSSEVRGEGSNERFICNILPEQDKADSLLVVEVKTPSGNWSSYPPHKHDSDNIPVETYLEETYYHRINPPQGFTFQRVYTDDLSIDETMAVEDRCVVLVPKGYHPVGVPHGYDSYYLNVMAGPKRQWIFNNDPKHEWMLEK